MKKLIVLLIAVPLIYLFNMVPLRTAPEPVQTVDLYAALPLLTTEATELPYLEYVKE